MRLLAALSLLSGCALSVRPIATRPSDNPQIVLEKLFDLDGCAVYRFYDGPLPRYFSKCTAGAVPPAPGGQLPGRGPGGPGAAQSEHAVPATDTVKADMEESFCVLGPLPLSGPCALARPLARLPVDNPHIVVERLVGAGGCTLYRFFGGPSSEAFRKCPGVTTSAVSWDEGYIDTGWYPYSLETAEAR
ncbi:MAG: hypothetical protein ACYDCL_13900 [Myxococcales bacterium]